MESSYLSSDAIFEILTRTSLDALDSCNRVCKQWSRIIDAPDFIPAYCARTDSQYGYLVQGYRNNRCMSDFVPVAGNQSGISVDFVGKKQSTDESCDVKIEAVSEETGLVCCVRRRGKEQRYYICKPSTMQWLSLPNPKMRYCTYRVALVVLAADPLRYMIIRLSLRQNLSYSPQLRYCRCEIFDSKTWAWKQLNDDPPLLSDDFLHLEPAISAFGTAHWLTANNKILTVHPISETYSLLPIPPSVSEDRDNSASMQLLAYDRRAIFTCEGWARPTEMWVMEGGYRNTLWRKIEPFEEPEEGGAPEAFCGSTILLRRGINCVVLYNRQNCIPKVVHLNFNADDIFPFRSDSKLVNLREFERV